jgi:hypothetical protein
MIHMRVDFSGSSFYETKDLELFQGIVEEMVAEAADVPEAERTALRTRAAAALFRCAADGERDPEVLKRRALAALRAGPPPTAP